MNIKCCIFMLFCFFPFQGDPRRNTTPRNVEHDYNVASINIVNAINETNAVEFNGYLSDDYKILKNIDINKTMIQFKKMIDKKGRIKDISNHLIINGIHKIDLEAENGIWVMTMRLNLQNKVDLLYFDEMPNIFIPKRNRTPLHLPFRDEWYVVWGGNTPEQNYHHDVDRNCRFAVDFTVVDQEGRACKNDGEINEDYYAFGKDILSVAAGEVVVVIDGVPDNRLGALNPLSSSGNTVIIRHSDFEYSVYMHLMRGSVKVHVGQKIQDGQILARCGNSGDSTGPHLHFQMMNDSSAYDATGFPAYFQNLNINKNHNLLKMEDYLPLRGDLVSSPR